MRYSKWLGIISCIILLTACFLPWTYHADVNKVFTGFVSEKNMYGKPGKFLCFFSIASIVLFATDLIWAKRLHLFLSALFVGYVIKTYTLYAGCYNAYCPEKRIGLYLVLFSAIVILLSSIFPDTKLKKDNT